jgi:hypothetical protein
MLLGKSQTTNIQQYRGNSKVSFRRDVRELTRIGIHINMAMHKYFAFKFLQ